MELEEMSKMEGKEMLPKNGKALVIEGNKTPQYLVTLAATMVAFAGGAVIGWTAPALPILQSANSTLPVTPEEGSWVGSLLAIGSFIGAFPAGPIADMIGRKITIMALAIPIFTSWAMVFLATSVKVLYMARLIAGIGIGAVCTVVPMYVAEIAESSVRGTLGSSFPFMLVSGLLYSYVLGAYYPLETLSLSAAALSILSFIVMIFTPETPLFLLMKNKREEAKKAMICIRGDQYNVNGELDALERELAVQTVSKAPFCEVATTKQGAMALLISWGLMAGQQLSGINIVVFFASDIFIEAGTSFDTSISTILVGVSQVLTLIVTVFVIDKLGRKILLQVSAAMMAGCMFMISYYFHVKNSLSDTSQLGMMPIVAILIYSIVFAFGFGPIPWMMSAEILPAEIKSLGTGYATAINWFLAFVVTKAFQPLLTYVGTSAAFFILGLSCIGAFLFSTYIVIETKGKSLMEIQEELAGKSTTRKKQVQPV